MSFRRGRKARDPNTPRRPPGRPPKDRSKLLETPKPGADAPEKPVSMDDGEASNSQDVKETPREAREKARNLRESQQETGSDQGGK